MATDFDKLKKVNQKYKDIVFGYVRGQANTMDHPIPDLIRSIILLFYYQHLKSSILTDTECDKLLTMFDEQNKFKEFSQYSFELIYSSKRDGNGYDKFAPKCEDKQNLFCLIHESKGNVFGGYTKRGWKSDDRHGCLEDKYAFVFSIRSSRNYPPKIFNCIKQEKALFYRSPHYYCMFGQACAFYIQQHGQKGGCQRISHLYEKYPEDSYLTAGKDIFNIIAIEVFQIQAY